MCRWRLRGSETAAAEVWLAVSEDLFSERGPWGTGTVTQTYTTKGAEGTDTKLAPALASGGGRPVFWCLDLCETSARTCIKLRRDPLGTRHETSISRANTPRTSFSHSGADSGSAFMDGSFASLREDEAEMEEGNERASYASMEEGKAAAYTGSADEAIIVSALSGASGRPSQSSGRVSFSFPAEEHEIDVVGGVDGGAGDTERGGGV